MGISRPLCLAKSSQVLNGADLWRCNKAFILERALFMAAMMAGLCVGLGGGVPAGAPVVLIGLSVEIILWGQGCSVRLVLSVDDV